eukprot:4829147-Alexandrium_andersonii.AAC.1
MEPSLATVLLMTRVAQTSAVVRRWWRHLGVGQRAGLEDWTHGSPRGGRRGRARQWAFGLGSVGLPGGLTPRPRPRLRTRI